ncbi:MAG: hypothetical protein KAT04_01510 [Methylococcales bacterium]|nr:hypothetical protein [Methylococcales bacterium]
MQDNDSFIYHISNGQMGRARSVESSLITAERSQKLDLLVHLIANLKQTLVICGANGIGKTSLLNELKQRKKGQWPMFSITASANLSFENIQQQLSQFLKQQYIEYAKLDLPLILPQLDKRNQKIVIIIDNSGLLVAGLISTLIQYAEATSCLRFVYALTDDEISIKNNTDPDIESGHFIEIPALIESQCAVFLQELSAQPDPLIQFNQIDNHLVEKAFRLTHGIPGKIVSELPVIVNTPATGGYKWLVMVVISVFLAFLITYLSYDKTELNSGLDDNKVPDISTEKLKTKVLSSKLSLLKSELAIDKKVTNGSVNELINGLAMQDNQLKNAHDKNVDEVNLQNQQHKEQLEDGLDIIVEHRALKPESKEGVLEVKKKPVTEIIIESPIAQKKIKTVNIVKQEKETVKQVKKIEPKKLAAEKDNSDWALNQPQTNYTIQLMVLSTPQALSSFFNKNQKIQNDIKFFQIKQNGQKKYILVYGSFASTEIALNKMKLLPVEFRKSWVRQFKNLQKELKP